MFVYGLEIESLENFEQVVNSLSEIAQDAQIALIPIYTNVRYLDEDWKFWAYQWQGAVLAAIAHAFAKRLTVISLASSDDIPGIVPYGSHPLLDPNYSSFDLHIRHDGVTLSRLEKTKLVVDWDVAFQRIRVCNRTERIRPGILNCGRCEKCIRTMLGLTALGVLPQTRAFPEKEISEELLWTIGHLPHDLVASYQELIGPLVEKGRHDLVRVIEHKIAVCYDREPGLRAKLRQLDQKFLNGNITRLKRRVYA